MPSPDKGMALADFTVESFSAHATTRDVYRLGTGPAVVVLHEVPGITPLVAAFGRRVAARGMTAVLPDLFGSPGREPSAGYLANSMLRACVSREFVTFATNRTSPIVRFLRALALSEHERCGGPGVGAVGMCLTGGFSLAMCVDPIVIAPVMSQPSLPLPIGARRRRDLGISEGDLAIIKDRTTDGLCAMGLRFSGDRVAPAERFARLQQELGSNFIGVQIDSSQPNPWGYATSAHSVLTEDYVDEENSPTRQALDGVLNFLESRLLTN